MRMYEKKCNICLIAFTANHFKAKFCPLCRPVNRRLLRKRWEKEFPEKNKARSKCAGNARRAREKGGGTVTTKQWRALLSKSLGKCCYCLQPGSTMDHVVPLSKGGSNTIDNIVVACMRCNTLKGTKSQKEFLASCQRRQGDVY